MNVRPKEKTVEEVKASLRERLKGRKAPFHVTDVREAELAIERIKSLDGEEWGTVWSAAGSRLEELAQQHEKAGRFEAASEAYFQAYGLYHVGRYPVPNHARKAECYTRSRECFIKGGSLLSPGIERVSVPFDGRAGEGSQVAFYVRKHVQAGPQPVVIRWSGIDTWKEERQDINERFFQAGFAVITMDMPGTGESPVLATQDGERQFLPVLDWIERQPQLDATRVALVGMSWGGYWATKLAYQHADRLAAVVNWAGPVHYSFERDWLLKSQLADSYLMDIQVARARCVGKTDYESYIEAASGLSLLDAGLLDRPHPPMLLVNGKDDQQQSLEDFMLLLQSGKPKAVRLFPGGHMGYTPQTVPTVVEWVRRTVADSATDTERGR
ncbi:alpha/beta hydrolase family protein [Paraburkholderia caffeinilytica]|uniref:alpha/beta hydrolase family protein n=1 Tax=Paraburkholderia caffeinilytica TaxID=1761016 RepID=UPI0038BD396F